MARTVLQDVDRVLSSAWYKAWALIHRTDANKIKLERAGSRRPIAGDSWARTFIEAIRVGIMVEPLPPPPPPPPPPPVYTLVAPKVANLQGGSNARYCVINQPGVWRQDDGTYRDAVARYDSDGLHLGGRSFEVEFGWTDGLVGAKEMDGRAPCDLPRAGDPTNNTGSWQL